MPEGRRLLLRDKKGKGKLDLVRVEEENAIALSAG